ncbi:hypothetical protein D3C87_1862690 [compost metagenome]
MPPNESFVVFWLASTWRSAATAMARNCAGVMLPAWMPNRRFSQSLTMPSSVSTHCLMPDGASS